MKKYVVPVFMLVAIKHPEPADMQAAFEEAIGGNLAKFFELTKKEGAFE